VTEFNRGHGPLSNVTHYFYFVTLHHWQ